MIRGFFIYPILICLIIFAPLAAFAASTQNLVLFFTNGMSQAQIDMAEAYSKSWFDQQPMNFDNLYSYNQTLDEFLGCFDDTVNLSSSDSSYSRGDDKDLMALYAPILWGNQQDWYQSRVKHEKPLSNLLDVAKIKNMNIGFISKSSLLSGVSHYLLEDSVSQLLDVSPEVIFTGDKKLFTDKEANNASILDLFSNEGYEVLLEGPLESVSDAPILGVFATEAMPVGLPVPVGAPSLVEMLGQTINKLKQQSDNGYLILVDLAHMSELVARQESKTLAQETLMLDEALAVVLAEPDTEVWVISGYNMGGLTRVEKNDSSHTWAWQSADVTCEPISIWTNHAWQFPEDKNELSLSEVSDYLTKQFNFSWQRATSLKQQKFFYPLAYNDAEDDWVFELYLLSDWLALDVIDKEDRFQLKGTNRVTLFKGNLLEVDDNWYAPKSVFEQAANNNLRWDSVSRRLELN